MPIFKIIKDIGNTKILLWKIIENEAVLLKKIRLSTYDLIKYNLISNLKRKKEFLTIRCILNNIGIPIKKIYYNKQGKPFLKDSKYYISFSHTKDIVSVGISYYPIGIDIETIRNKKILCIKKKFLRNDELPFINDNDYYIIEKLHIIWGIKECLYKINESLLTYNINNYKVMPFNLYDKKIKTWLLKNNLSKIYWAYHKKINNYQLVYIIDYE